MELTERFYEALDYAARLHARQQRKLSGTPYVAHLLRVCGTVLEVAEDEDEVLAALLHDAVEDQGGAAAAQAIRARFGDRVTELVLACSDTDQMPKPPWRERKEAYLAHLQTSPAAACRISAADKLDNVRSLTLEFRRFGEAMWGRFQGGRDGSLWYFRSVVEILKQRSIIPLAEELERAVDELERLVRREGS